MAIPKTNHELQNASSKVYLPSLITLETSGALDRSFLPLLEHNSSLGSESSSSPDLSDHFSAVSWNCEFLSFPALCHFLSHAFSWISTIVLQISSSTSDLITSEALFLALTCPLRCHLVVLSHLKCSKSQNWTLHLPCKPGFPLVLGISFRTANMHPNWKSRNHFIFSLSLPLTYNGATSPISITALGIC